MQHYQRREVQDWLNLFEQQKQSGLTAVEFCRQQQINVQTYYTRRRDRKKACRCLISLRHG
ncbi:IS66 family insertion sequence element accessory protein TnpA [Alteromonas oceani]